MIDELITLRDKLSAGKTAYDKSEIASLAVRFNSILQLSVNQLSTESDVEIVIFLNEIFHLILVTGFSKDFANTLDKEIYFPFGISLEKSLSLKSDHLEIKKLAHHYLDLFRFPSFLQTIYDEQRWGNLIVELINKSNFNLFRLFHQRLEIYSDKTLFKIVRGNMETNFLWRSCSELVDNYSSALIQNLVSINDEYGKVAFLLENSIEMALLDIACLTSGIINVMTPANSVREHIVYILNKTQSSIIFLEDEKQLIKIKSIRNELTHLKKAILMNGFCSEGWVISFEEFLDCNQSDKSLLNERRNKIDINDLATIMFTSGTTGEPKGIMFSQKNIIYKRFCRSLAIPEIGEGDKFLAYLPLFHTFGRYFEMLGSIFWAAEYVFMENPSAETMIANMKEVKPTIFISIPKKWTELYDLICSKINIETELHDKILQTVKELTGGKLRWGLSAAGFLPSDIFQFFQKYGIELMSGFGMTEATGGITMTPPNKYKLNSLGKALPGIEIKLGEDGELLIKGDYVMTGYFGEEQSETFTHDGWLPTGDVMQMDSESFIEIIDRKKEIYKNVKGETIAPQKIENYFRDFETVQQVFLVGDHKPFNTVLIYPNYDQQSINLKLLTSQQVQEYFSTLIVTVNKFLSPFERILDFRLIDRPFSAEDEELTPKGTYKRRNVEKNFSKITDSMYEKDFTAVTVDNIEVRIPNWFLRERGCLSRDVMVKNNFIIISDIPIEISLSEKTDNSIIIKIGDYYYRSSSKQIDLQDILVNPLLWLGNKAITDFSGNSVYSWYRQNKQSKKIFYYASDHKNELSDYEKETFNSIRKSKEINLACLHFALRHIQSKDEANGKAGVDYLRIVLNEDSSIYKRIIYEVLLRQNLAAHLAARRELFKLAIEKLKGIELKTLFQNYLSVDSSILDKDVIKVCSKFIRGDDDLTKIEEMTEEEIEKTNSGLSINKTAVPVLFELLSNYGIDHPAKFKGLRQFFVKHKLNKSNAAVSELASKYRLQLREGFRNWLGVNQRVAVDPETGEEYSWSEVIILEEEMDLHDRTKLSEVIIETNMLREALFLFSGGTRVGLNDLPPGGIWVSKLYDFSAKNVYRVSVQTRYYGSFDIMVTINKSIPREMVQEEINWLILAGSRFFIQELVDDFGGYWEDYESWSQKFIPGDTVEKFFQREMKRNNPQSEIRLYYLWQFFVWNASAAFINFWRLSNFNLILSEPKASNVIIPPHDYQSGTRFVSLSDRKYFTDLFDLTENFFNHFVIPVQVQYPFLDQLKIWNFYFSGIINALGEQKGLLVLGDLLSLFEVKKYNSLVINLLEEYLLNVNQNGFIPKQLFFAVKRFLRWMELNHSASLNAQAETLYDIFETYNLSDLEKTFPATRTKFFLETCFSDSEQKLREALHRMAQKQRSKSLSKEELISEISDVQNQNVLSDKEKFFLTRLSYPHLKPTDSAALMHLKADGIQQVNLVVTFEDFDGNNFVVRSPVSPKEISKLHQLFIEANLNVHFRPEHQFLAAISERGFIIGGLYFSRQDNETIYMEKIAVLSRYRRKGISEALMNELFNRMKSENYKYITTGFFRPEYFYRFGFKIEKKYSGLVKELN